MLKNEYEERFPDEKSEVVKEHEQIYKNQRKSFTKNCIILGGVPLYVETDFRPSVIPGATIRVECFYDTLRILDGYETIKGSKDNFFVQVAFSL